MKGVDRLIYPSFYLKRISPIKVGGKVDAYIEIYNLKGAIKTLKELKRGQYRYFFIGKGTNVVYQDNYEDKTIAINLKANSYKIIDDVLYVEGGILLSSLAHILSSLSYEGWSKLEGIPGTLAGALINNAGAFKSSISDNLIDLLFVDEDGNIKIVSKEEMEYAYRYSKAKHQPMGLLFSARFRLIKGNLETIKNQEKEALLYRLTNQPRGILTLGSTFKNGDNYYAGQIIERAGLKGYKLGHVKISEKHANFLEIEEGASANEINDFVAAIKKIVYNKYTISLELEIEIQGGEEVGSRRNQDECLG